VNNKPHLREIRNGIISGIESVHGKHNSEHVRRLLRRVLEMDPMENPIGYAFITGRNWAIGQYRKENEAERMKKITRKRQRRERAKQQAFQRAEQEFLHIAALLSPSLHHLQYEHLEITWMICFGGSDDAQCANIYPKTNRDQRYQWKRRGVKLVLPHASKNLKAHLNTRR